MKKWNDLITWGNALADEMVKDVALKAREFDSLCKQWMMLEQSLIAQSMCSLKKLQMLYVAELGPKNGCHVQLW